MSAEYTYIDKSINPPVIIFQCVCPDLLIANTYFERIMGKDPLKCPWISLQTKELPVNSMNCETEF